MKFFKWKIFFITGIVCLLPILSGVFLWDKLPQNIPIHFDIYGNPDNYSDKAFAVFGLPFMMLAFQWICCFINDLNSYKNKKTVKLETISKWIVPCVTVLLYIITLGYALGFEIDIRKAACVIVGVMFLVIGNYLPKLDYIKNYKITKEKARKINRFTGYLTVFMGLIIIISIFFPPQASVIALLLTILYSVLIIIYTISQIRK